MDKELLKSLRGLMIFAALLVLAVIHLDKVLFGTAYIFSIFQPFIIGAAMAFVLNIPMKFIEGKLFQKKNKAERWKRPISFLLTVCTIVLVLWLICMLIVPQLTATFSELAVQIPIFFQKAVKGFQETFENNPEILSYVEGIDISDLDWHTILTKALNMLKSGIGSVVISTVNVAGSVFGVIFDLVVAFVFAIYILMQKEKLISQTQHMLQAYLSEKLYSKADKIAKLLYRNFSNFISSQCLEAVILGMLFVITMPILGFPYAVLIGTLIAVTALVPIVGACIGCVVGAFLILVNDPIKAVWFVVLFLVLQQLEGNLIYPRVVGGSVGLPAIWVLVAVSVGGSLFGIIGMLVFIPITSTLYTLLREDVHERNKKKTKLKVSSKRGSKGHAKQEADE